MISKIKSIVFVLGFISSIGFAQSKGILPKNYVAYKTSEKIQIDGEELENSWSKAEWTDAFIDIEGVDKPKYNTKVKMLWDDKNYYILEKFTLQNLSLGTLSSPKDF